MQIICRETIIWNLRETILSFLFACADTIHNGVAMWQSCSLISNLNPTDEANRFEEKKDV
jgi:hypothetical protein